MKSLTICLTPDDVEQRLTKLGTRCAFTPEERAQYATTPLVSGAERLFAFPTPAENVLSLSHIKDCVGTDPARQPCFFEHPWYQDEEFMRTRIAGGWHVLSMDVLADSILQPANYLGSLPTAVEVVLMLFLHYVGTGEQLLLKKHSWCADSATLGRQVTVGAFGRNGVFISGHPPNYVSRGLGTCARVSVPKLLDI